MIRGMTQRVAGKQGVVESPAWTEFATDGATFALHKSETSSGRRDEATEAPGGCRPGLSVPNLDEFHKRMVEAILPYVQEPKSVLGTRVAQYLDPDGRPFLSAKNPPSDCKFADHV